MSVENYKNKTIYHIKHPTAGIISKAVLFYLDNILSKSNINYPRLVVGFSSKSSSEIDNSGTVTVASAHHRKTNNSLIKRDKNEEFLNYQVSNLVVNNVLINDNIKFYFNGNEILFSVKKSGEPLWDNCNDTIEYYQIFELIADKKNILDEFLLCSKKFFDDEIMQHKKLDNEINTQIWDDYWENSGKIRKRKLNTIYLPKDVSNNLMNDINNFLKPSTKEFYEEMGISYKRIFMLEGPPGSGKTSLITSIASELDYDISFLNFTPSMDDHTLIKAIKKIKDDSILVIEDIDCLFVNRKNTSDKNKKHRISFSGLLNSLDGVCKKNNLIIFMTTNHIDLLDEALIRPGRIDYIITFDYANDEQIKNITNKFLPEISDNIINQFIRKIGRKNVSMASLQQFLMGVKFSKDENKEVALLDIKKMVLQKDSSHEVMYS